MAVKKHFQQYSVRPFYCQPFSRLVWTFNSLLDSSPSVRTTIPQIDSFFRIFFFHFLVCSVLMYNELSREIIHFSNVNSIGFEKRSPNYSRYNLRIWFPNTFHRRNSNCGVFFSLMRRYFYLYHRKFSHITSRSRRQSTVHTANVCMFSLEFFSSSYRFYRQNKVWSDWKRKKMSHLIRENEVLGAVLPKSKLHHLNSNFNWRGINNSGYRLLTRRASDEK